jgi:acetyltransferase-like isoleucine patch superfamily enzyme
MLLHLVRPAIMSYVMRTGRGTVLYRRICKPDGREHAEYLRRHGGFHAIGEHCSISTSANITDPAYVKIGNNVRISACSIFGHDGSVNMLNRAFGLKLDNVGRVVIRDNVYLAEACIIQPNVTIGPNAIVSAGSVVNRDVAEGMIVAGVPARPVGTTAMLVEILQARNERYPWRSLTELRSGEFDPALEPELMRMRVAHFFPADGDA